MHGTDVLRISLNISGIVLNVSWETNWILFSEPMAQSMLNPVCLDSLGTVLILSAANKTNEDDLLRN